MYGVKISPPGTVAAPAYTLQETPADTAYCHFVLENLGNARDSLLVSARTVAPSTVTPDAVILFRDTNGNGVFDAGEDDPTAFAIDAGDTLGLDVGVVLPPVAPGGDAYVEVEAASALDPAGAFDRSVLRVHVVAPSSTLFLGPAGNPRALPGGNGSADDVTLGTLGYEDVSYTFENELLNAAPYPQLVELVLPAAASLAPGVRFTVLDSTGAAMTGSPASGRRFQIGSVAAGRSTRFQLVVTSTTGEPLFKLPPSRLSFRVIARAVADTTETDDTIDRLASPEAFNPGAAIVIRQTFHETVASAGDVVSLVVTVENITDSLRVDDIDVTERVDPQLDFAGSSDFEWRDGRLRWRAGTLAGGESRTGVARFVANTRVPQGKARAVATAAGRAQSGDDVTAGPVSSAIRIENDAFGAEGVIIGDVFVDADGDGRRGADEAGVPGVAVFLESGEYAVTDSAGAFTIPRVFAGYRMVRLDESDLPDRVHPGETPAGESPGPRPNERLVHLLRGGHARVSFPLERTVHVDVPAPVVTTTVSYQEKVSVIPREGVHRFESLPSSYFALGKAELSYGIDAFLGPIVAFLDEHPGWALLVEGHTDSQPIHTDRFPSNKELSFARAQAVRDWVSSRGIERTRVIVFGYGDTRPVASNATIEGRRNNRRVELTMVPPYGVAAAAGAADPGAVVHALADRPDTARVTIHWRFTSSGDAALPAALAVQLPDRVDPSSAVVSIDGAEAWADTTLQLSRAHPIDCEVAFDVSVDDTAAISEVRALLGVDGRRAVIRPLAGGTSTAVTTTHEIMEHSATPASAATEPAATSPATAPGARAEDDTRAVAIVDPLESDVFSKHDRIRVRARLPLGTHTRLLVNGMEVAQSQLGQRDIDVARGTETIAWYAVQIAPGWNTLAVESRLIDGTVEVDSLRVALAARPAAVRAVRERVLVAADGHTGEAIAFEVIDRLGLPVADGTVATVTEGGVLLSDADARPDVAGLQVLVQGGRATVTTAPKSDTGRGTIAVECGGFSARCDVSFVSAQKSLFATGIVDVNVGARSKSGSGSGDGVDGFYDGLGVEGESRLFVQGTMPHEIGVTARLDTRKRYDDPLLKDIDPDRQYPVFGDASTLHQAAPARGGNYVSLDREESYVRYGDFRTPITDGEFLAYRRAATGFSSELVDGERSLSTFVTRTDFSAHQDELPADGTSGFYYLGRAPVVEFSEQIVLETRDRYRTEKVLDVRPVVRNRDYTINYFDGSVLFKEPVAAFDRDFNPVMIVANYEVETGDAAQYLYGARGKIADGARYRVGSTAVARSGDGQNYALYGADGEATLGALRLAGEVARSEDDAAGAGNAFKLEAHYDGGRHQHSAYLRRVDGDFTNPSFRGAGQELSSLKTGFQSRLDVGNDVSFESDGFIHELDRTGERKENLRALATFRHPLLRFQGGLRVAGHEQASGNADAALTILGVELGSENAAGVATLWEKNLAGDGVEDYPDRLRTHATLPFWNRYKLLASHEYLTSSGRGASHQLFAGVESRLTASTTAYSKYSMNRTASDERMGAVTGLKQQVPIRDGVSGTLGVESYRSLSDRPDDDYVSVKTGLGARRPGRYLLEGQYEYRWQTRRSKHLLRLNAARELRSGFAALLKNVLSVAPDGDAMDALAFHNQIGVAQRPVGGRVQSLWMMRNDYERYTPVNPDAVTWRFVLSGDVNVTPVAGHEVRAKYAFKHVENYSYGASTTTNADLVLGQYVYRFARNWDADVWGRVVRQRAGGTVETGSGVEVGRLFFRSLRVAAGYSAGGFDDPDFAGTDAHSRGFGVRLQLLLSDWILNEMGWSE